MNRIEKLIKLRNEIYRFWKWQKRTW